MTRIGNIKVDISNIQRGIVHYRRGVLGVHKVIADMIINSPIKRGISQIRLIRVIVLAVVQHEETHFQPLLDRDCSIVDRVVVNAIDDLLKSLFSHSVF